MTKTVISGITFREVKAKRRFRMGKSTICKANDCDKVIFTGDIYYVGTDGREYCSKCPSPIERR